MAEGLSALATRHLSIRVPWHDSGWSGHICRSPRANAECLVLDRIRELRDDDWEEEFAGSDLRDLPSGVLPPCADERATFMAPVEITRTVTHPYRWSNSHKRMLPTPMHQPPYSAPVIPFRWMNKKWAWDIAEERGLSANPDHEPPEPDFLARTAWVQGHSNQRTMLEGFFGAVVPQRSLAIFYAKRTPLSDDERRVIVGIGRVTAVEPPREYAYDSTPGLRSYIWDCPVRHSIRPECDDGFLMPYAQLLETASEHSLDLEQFVAFAPADRRLEFSFAGEHVSHDGAIAALLACRGALERTRSVVDGPWDSALAWINDRMGELWRLRGPYPGLGAALKAFGIEHGTFLAWELAAQLTDNEDPWPLVDRVIRDPSDLPTLLRDEITDTLQATWKWISEREPQRLALLKLVARFELTPDQATVLWVPEVRSDWGVDVTDDDLIANPYSVYEATRSLPNAISLLTVDRGLFPPPVISEHAPLPAPSALQGPTDGRRIRALTIGVLEGARSEGHTMLPRASVVTRVRELPLEPGCPISGDTLSAVEDLLDPLVTRCELADGSSAYQLDDLRDAGEIIRRAVGGRLKGARHDIEADWRALLDAKLSQTVAPSDDEEEARAREEKAKALEELASARLSVLIGPAGTGKTLLLSVLCGHPSIAAGGVLLLAPTGKARVQMGRATGLPAKTLAQFLLPLDRYDEQTGSYLLNGKTVDDARTVIVDEASMLTESQLASLIGALRGVERLILVGDPRQLPPIGAGRPFVDIVSHLSPSVEDGRFPRVADGIADLTVRRRHAGRDTASADGDDPPDVRLADIRLAEWFSGRPVGPGEDQVLGLALAGDRVGSRLRFVEWHTPDEFQARLIETIVEELGLAGKNDARGFELSLGATEDGDYRYFNASNAAAVDGWQILSPVRGLSHGAIDINRMIQHTFRQATIDLARDVRKARICKPMGAEGIVYGDKVINVVNRRRTKVWPTEGADCYVANGEIGLAVGQLRTTSAKFYRPWLLKVAFSSQIGFAYDYSKGDFSDDGDLLELAYAITVHKAQGSEFGTCFLVLPNPCRLLSRELLYTALTRQQKRIVVLHQGPRHELWRYASAEHSEIASRLTNLFERPDPVSIDGAFLENHLIHRSRRGELMRSKSEVIIADALSTAGVDYEYEARLVLGGAIRYPDFRVDDAESGRTFFWEHCGMLGDPAYRRRWEAKQVWYREHGVLPLEEGGGPAGALIVTEDSADGGIDSKAIHELVAELF